MLINSKNPSSSSFQVSSLNSLSASKRFNGMIHEKFNKKIRNLLFRLFDYVSATSPNMLYLHQFISVWRLLQFVGPAICSSYSILWKDHTLALTVDIISILYHIFPGFIREQTGIYVLFGYFAVIVITLIIIFSAAIYFNKKAELPQIVITLITVIFSTVGYILHPVCLQSFGELVSLMIVTRKANALAIVSMVLSITVFIIYIYIYVTIYSLSLTFRPDSLMTIMPVNQTLTLICTLVITLLTSVASNLEKIPCIALTFVAAIMYLISLYVFFSRGGFVSMTISKSMAASSLFGFVALVVICIMVLLERKGNEILLISFVFDWIICYLIINIIIKKINKKHMDNLDNITDNPDYFETLVKNSRVFADCVVSGFRNAHPICLSFDIFKMGIEKFPKSFDVWLLFAKFTAIYPEETQQLSFAVLGMIQNHMKGSYAKHTMQQIEAVIKQRETNLIPELKSKLDGIGKKVSACKAKIRYIWDLVLQGNTNELEMIVGRAHQNINQIETDFHQLLGKFPNNRFVARAYARFLRDVVADHDLHQIWVQKCVMLSRGCQVAVDNPHNLGIIAFPNLPTSVDLNQKGLQQQTNNNLTEDTLTQEIEEEDSFVQDIGLKQTIKENISNMVIPSYQKIRILHIFSLCFFFIIPMILITVFAPIYIDDITGSLKYLNTMAQMRTVLFQALGVCIHYVNENIDWKYPDDHPKFPGKLLFPFPTYEEGIEPYVSNKEIPSAMWGSTFNSKKQLQSLNVILSGYITDISSLKSYKVGNKAMDLARTSIFEESTWFTYVFDTQYVGNWHNMSTDMNDFYTRTRQSRKSVVDIVSQFISIYQEVVNLEEVEWDSYNKHYMGTILNNIKNTSIILTSTVSELLSYITTQNTEILKITQIAMIVFIIFIIIWYSVLWVYTVKEMANDKLTIYKCLTSLQKSIISKVAETFRILRKEDDEDLRSTRSRDEELSRQEENLLKLFSTCGDTNYIGSSQTMDPIFNFITSVILIALHIVLTIVIIVKFKDSSIKLNNTSPHIEHSMASYAFDLCTIFLILLLPGAVYPSYNFNIYGYNAQTLITAIQNWQDYALRETTLMKYGDPVNNAPSLSALGISVKMDDSYVENCHNETFIKKPYSNYHDFYNCLSPEMTVLLSQMTVQRLVNIYNHTTNKLIYSGDDIYLTNIWHIHQHHIYDRYFYPLSLMLLNLVQESIETQVPVINKIGYTIIAIAALIELIFLISLIQSEKRQKFAMTLLLQCPAKSVLANNHVVSVLGGDFNIKNQDTTTRDADFYDELVENMPDSIILLKNDGTIISANKATERIYGITIEDLMDSNYNFNNSNGTNDMNDTNQNNESNGGKKSSMVHSGNKITKLGSLFKDENPFKGVFESEERKKISFEKHVVLVKENKQEVHISLTYAYTADAVGGGIFVDSKDITQSVMYDKLIHDEKVKSDGLLSAILPPKIVPRVAMGEKNISFAVQSATIVFMDIVSFTPWCGSLPAATVMKTLNILFKNFDSLVAQHITMTKIKCIGDCYMAAGGIFAEVNQPAVHAKDVVDFGLDSIDAILRIDEKNGQNLRIRVGINTGGPIVAGVLGTEKPTFEILGPTINMAQQMEHHGVPMKVHISRAVYELIYGGSFKVHERGQVELRNGSAITYLVERKGEE